MKEKLLFVTKAGSKGNDGFSYALELAKTLNAALAVLLVYERDLSQTYEDVMAAVTFAEAGDLQTVKRLMNEDAVRIKETEAQRLNELAERCRQAGVEATFEVAGGSPLNAIKEFIKAKPAIEMVLMSPDLSAKGSRVMKKLLKNISRPVVAIMPAEAGAK